MKVEDIPIGMLITSKGKWISAVDIEKALETIALEETNPKVRTRLFELKERVKRL